LNGTGWYLGFEKGDLRHVLVTMGVSSQR